MNTRHDAALQAAKANRLAAVAPASGINRVSPGLNKAPAQKLQHHPRTEAQTLEVLENAGTLYVEAAHLMSQQRWNAAIALLEQSVRLDATFAEAWQALGNCYENCEALELSIKAYQNAMGLRPFDMALVKQVAVLAERLQAWEFAAYYFARYVKRCPNEVDARFGWAVALEYLERFDEAIAVYEGILETHPQHLPAINNVAGCYMHLNDHARAIRGFQQVLEKVPSFPRAILGLAIAQDVSGQTASAVMGYRRYLQRQPQSVHAETVRERLAEIHLERHG